MSTKFEEDDGRTVSVYLELSKLRSDLSDARSNWESAAAEVREQAEEIAGLRGELEQARAERAAIWRKGFCAAEEAIGLNHAGVDLCPYPDHEPTKPATAPAAGAVPVSALRTKVEVWRSEAMNDFISPVRAEEILDRAKELEALANEAAADGEGSKC